jgi:PAS domain-containing protein
MDWWLGAKVFLISSLAASLCILGMVFFSSRAQGRRGRVFEDAGSEPVFVFDGDVLLDCSPEGRALLAASPVQGGPWLRLIAYLSLRFPDIEARLLRLPVDGRITLSTIEGVDQPRLLQAELRGGLTRLTLIDPEAKGRRTDDPVARTAHGEELEGLRQAVAQAPVLIWRERNDGQVIWGNAAYLHHATALIPVGEDLTWPLPRVFDLTATSQGALGQRQRLDTPGGGSAWFDLTTVRALGGRLLYAAPADSAVQAENALREFMQTLAKTFAHLPIGLAVFDRQRLLQLFNPAMMDLTGLPADFLSGRPALLAFLDAMRDRSMIPEPKDYRGWQRQIVSMEKAAANGLYEETWSLAAGQTYRVSARPHPNGALALMIEDISTEMSRTRRYRADLELGQAVIDALDEGIAVFSPSGQLVMSNAAYASLWGHDPEETLGDGGILAISAHWRNRTSPNPCWALAEEYVATLGTRDAWEAEARLGDGRLIGCRFAPLSGGATLAAFRLADADAPAPRLAATENVRTA